MRRYRFWISLMMVGLLGTAACTRSPSDGRLSLASGSIENDQKIGSDNHPKIVEQYGGTYSQNGLDDYVANIGNRLAAVSELNDIPFTFTLLDSDVVNAFALPGGYVYVSRGLLALANDEAEVAGVIGHEIGHVTSRHGAERQASAAIGQGIALLGAVGGAILGGNAGAQLGSQIGKVGGAGFLGQYSQSQEFESDKLGVRYLGRTGYDTFAMADFLKALQTNAQFQSKVAGRSLSQGGFDHFFASHPYTPDRVVRAMARAEERDHLSEERYRDRFLEAIDGMIYGQSPDQGYVLGRRFAHPVLRFEFTSPDGYSLRNRPTQVVAGGENSVIIFDLDGSGYGGSLSQYKGKNWTDFSKLSNVQNLNLRRGYEGVLGFGTANVNNQKAEAGFVVIRAPDDKIYRFALLSKDITRGLRNDLIETAESFKILSNRDLASLKPQRIRVLTVKPGDTIDDFARMMDVDKLHREHFIMLNGFDRGRELKAGDRVKIIKRS